MRETSVPEYELELALTSEMIRPFAPVSVKAKFTVTVLTPAMMLGTACAEISPRRMKLAPSRFAADSAASGSFLK